MEIDRFVLRKMTGIALKNVKVDVPVKLEKI